MAPVNNTSFYDRVVEALENASPDPGGSTSQQTIQDAIDAAADIEAIKSGITAIDTDATTIIGHVDNIENSLTTINTNIDAVEASLGATADVAATTDTGTFGLIALFKRFLSVNLAAINNKLPALVSSRIPVDGSGVTQPISAASLPLPTGAATSANQIGFSTTANTPSILTSAGEALAANSSRKQFSIQNLGTNPLYVRFGASDATTSVFQFCLSPGTSNDDGRGAIYIDNCWHGRVSIAGTSPRCAVMELT